MKNLSILFVVAICLYSCKKDNKEPAPNYECKFSVLRYDSLVHDYVGTPVGSPWKLYFQTNADALNHQNEKTAEAKSLYGPEGTASCVKLY